MSKLDGWRPALDNVLHNAVQRVFDWGEHDCACGLAFPAILVQTGLDLWTPYRGKYSSAIGALKLIRREGYRSVGDYIERYYPQCSNAEAQFGDIAALDGDETGMALGIVLGERVTVLSPCGAGTVDRCQAKFAYRIG